MVRPNIVVESKGRHLMQRLISEEEVKQNNLKNTEIDRLDDAKTAVKLMPAPANDNPSITKFYGLIYNDSSSDDTWILKSIQWRMFTAWTAEVKIDDVVYVSGSEIVTTANQIHTVELTMQRSLQTVPPDPALIRGECAFSIIQIYPKSSGDILSDQDAFKIVGILPMIDFDQIDLNMEQLIEDEVIFPEAADHVTADVVQAFINNRSTEVIEWLIRRFNGVTVPDYEPVRRFLINRVKKDCYQRFIDFSVSGGNELLTNIRELKMEAMEILKTIQADGDIDW